MNTGESLGKENMEIPVHFSATWCSYNYFKYMVKRGYFFLKDRIEPEENSECLDKEFVPNFVANG